jgi:hypothetical protein
VNRESLRERIGVRKRVLLTLLAIVAFDYTYVCSLVDYFIIITTIAICAYRERCFVTIVSLLNICDNQATASY